MRFLADQWLDDATNVASEERATVADFRVLVGDQNVTMHLIESENENHITVPLYSLVEGIAHEWWTLFGGRDREVSLLKFRMGYAVPDVRMKYDGAAFDVSAHQYTYRNPDIRFWAGPSETLTRGQAEAELDGFVSMVLERLKESKVAKTSAELRWERVLSSRADKDVAGFCEAAGALGVDPYQVNEKIAAEIAKAGETFDGEPLIEFLAGLQGGDRQSLFQWIDQAERRPAYQSRVSDLRPIAEAAAGKAPAKEHERSWALGYRRARAVRQLLDLKAGHRFLRLKSLARRFGASEGFRQAPQVDGIRALRSDRPNEVHIHLRDHGKAQKRSNSELFAFARAVGDVACFPMQTKAPVNELRDASRQSAGRAFAAEFLAPIQEILSMESDGKDIHSIAYDLNVDEAVVQRQLENSQRIEEACR